MILFVFAQMLKEPPSLGDVMTIGSKFEKYEPVQGDSYGD